MPIETTILIAVAGVLFVACMILLGALISARRKLKDMHSGSEEVEKIKVVDGVRYTQDKAVKKDGELNVTHNVGDITLVRGKEYQVVKNGEIMPGKYQILTSDGSTEIFNIRIGNFVREFAHNTPIVLAEGDKICSVSHTVILR